MEYYKIYALLNADDVVEDVIMCKDQEEADNIAKSAYISGKALNVNKFDVKIGDFYRDRTFFRCVEPGNLDFGIEVDSSLTLEEQIYNLTSILEKKDLQIEFLENIIKENGLGKLIE